MKKGSITQNVIEQNSRERAQENNAHYSTESALLCAQAAAWSYSKGETLQARLTRLGMKIDLCKAFHVQNSGLFLDAHAFLSADYDSKIAILSFRGTEVATGTNIDLLADMAVDPVAFNESPHWRVHGGFYSNLHSVWHRILVQMEEILPKIDYLYFTGHSLGGALAVLAAAELYLDQDGKQPASYTALREKFCGLYTFGQPMVGNERFADECEKQFGHLTYRHVYHKDLIAVLPPKTSGEFCHFGQEFHVSKENTWERTDHESKQVNTLLLSLPLAGLALLAKHFPWSKRLPTPHSLGDHLPYYYLDVAIQSVTGETLNPLVFTRPPTLRAAS